jgi:putative heme-binding domain-containing protein
MCHGLDGRGGEHAPGIANSKDVQERSEEALEKIVRQGIPAAGMPAFGSLPQAEIVAVVKYVRSLSGSATGEAVKGDPQRGDGLFFGKGQCGACHMMVGKGGFIGTDLSGLAVAFSPAQIREAIVHPDEKLPPGQQVTSIETADGRKWTGLVRNEDNFSVQLQEADGTFHLLMKAQVAKMERSGQSLMPADYGARLSSAELDDLVAYIVRYGRHAEAPAGTARHRPR